MLSLEPAEVLLSQLDGEVLGSSVPTLLLQEMVEVSLGPQLILKGLDGQLQVLQGERWRRRRRKEKKVNEKAKCYQLLPHYEDGMVNHEVQGPAMKSSTVTSEAWDST